jgi:hypothetical protein
METRQGLIEFRNQTVTEQVTVKRDEHKKPVTQTITRVVLQFRQCFKGMWTAWKPVVPE